MTYECLQRFMNPEGKKLGIMSTILAGGTAGIMNWLVCIPADVAKSRLQTGEQRNQLQLKNIKLKR